MEKYKTELKEIGITFKKVAEKLGISNTLFSMYLNGDRNMPDKIEDHLKKIIQAYKNI